MTGIINYFLFDPYFIGKAFYLLITFSLIILGLNNVAFKKENKTNLLENLVEKKIWL